MQTDFLIIGSGLAGLNYVLNVARTHPDKKILAVTKGNEDESNTKYAQGGVAIVHKTTDSFDKHIQDTLIAGDGLCKKEIVEMVINEGPECLAELTRLGVNFDKDKHGNYDLGKEGGHSENRVVHFQDITGWEIERSLIEQVKKLKNVQLLDHHFALDLITDHHAEHKDEVLCCYGAYVLNQRTHEVIRILSRITFLATGGVGQVYSHTTNPTVATGDGIAMAYRAKAKIQDTEFIQFHPTALFEHDVSPAFLISEAVRGFGAKLRTKNGEAFMHKYDAREELASRDIVARAIDTELKKNGQSHVLLDCRELNQVEFNKHFPNIRDKCLSIGIDPAKQMIPVVPAQHYICGGISTNATGETTVRNLFAAGECAHTGLHGANRLASNSLLEAFVFSKKAAIQSSKIIDGIPINDSIKSWDSKGTTTPEELILITHNRTAVQNIMWDYVGIVRSNKRLQRSMERLDFLYRETEDLYRRSTLSPQLCELRNLITIAYLITQHSILRKENKGGFFNSDLKKTDTSVTYL